MTLAQNIVTPWGVWQCSDHRLTDYPSMEPRAHFSVKFVIVKCTDGWISLTYTGVGRVRRDDLGDSVRRRLVGGTGTVHQCLHVIADHMSSLFQCHVTRPISHVFIGGGFVNDQPVLASVFNGPSQADWSSDKSATDFYVAYEEISDPHYLAIGHPRRS